MLSYELLDTIADSVNPVLGMLWLGCIFASLWRRCFRSAWMQFLFGVSALSVAYGIMWLDNKLVLLHSIGLDYSTHTAVAAALSLSLVLFSPLAVRTVPFVLLSYIALMVYQQYHSVADILVTLLLLALPFGLLTSATYRSGVDACGFWVRANNLKE